jgi:hypothetical protein
MYIIYVTEANKLYKRALNFNAIKKTYEVTIPERHFIICAFIEENIVKIATSFLSVEECFFQEYYPANINIGLLPQEAFRGENELFSFQLL